MINESELRFPVILPEEPGMQDQRLAEVLETALSGLRPCFLRTAEETAAWFLGGASSEDAAEDGRAAEDAGAAAGAAETESTGSRRFRPVLFAVALGSDGVNLEYMRLLRLLRNHEGILDGYVGGVIIDGASDLYTKAVSRELVFTANAAGCAFVGRPLVEGTRTLSNFTVVARNLDTDIGNAYRQSAAVLVRELLHFGSGEENGPHLLGKGGLSVAKDGAKRAGEKRAEHTEEAENASAGTENAAAKKSRRPRILVLHASIRATSNTLELWHRTAALLPEMEIREISLQNGTLYDCAGCPYHTCLHFGEKNSCFYGGVMVEEVYPAVREADAIVMLCANYNDALSANLTAFINRLTALFRQVRFYDKALFAVVVSGYSGSDIVAEQLIAALNMNKTFYLPPRFAMLETANDAGQAVRLPGIEARIRAFAENIRRTLLPG